MPLSLVVALIVAFGIEPPAGRGPVTAAEAARGGLEALGGLAGLGALALGLGLFVARRVAAFGYATTSTRRAYALGSRGVELLALAVFAWIVHGLNWPRLVGRGLGLRGVFFVDECLVLLPYLLAQAAVWAGLYPAERALRAIRPGTTPAARPARYLWLRFRQAAGVLLPVALVYSIGHDIVRRRWPGLIDDPRAQLGWMALMGTAVLVLAPAFVRLTWPTRPLPPGPLRGRLERLSARLGFRCSDIRVWDTGGMLVNAGVTGAAPWFRYVLLTDALIERLDDRQIEAVFGHEVGHIAHRHLFSFALFFLGSMGVAALVGEAIDRHVVISARLLPWAADLAVGELVKAAVALLLLGIYVGIVFGVLSRRFERQADVYGCRAVSCGRAHCPPHADLNAADPGLATAPATLCPVGIQIFAAALADVATHNGMRPTRRSWRHGSIARRIAFLRTLEDRPDAERRFQAGVLRLRVALGLLLTAALVWSLL